MVGATSAAHAANFPFAVEVLVMIFGLLDFKALLRCSETCKHFREVINNTAALRYIIELAVDGLVDGDPNHPSTASQRLEAVLNRRSRWRSLNWTHKESIPVGYYGLAYDFSAPGVLAWIAYELAPTHSIARTLLKVRNLPEGGKPVTEGTYYISTSTGPNGEVIQINHVLVQPSTDLIVFVENGRLEAEIDENDPEPADVDFSVIPICMHLRSLSSGGQEPHPLCRDAVIEYDLSNGLVEAPRIRKVSLDWNLLSALASNSGRMELCIWDHTTGDELAGLHSSSFECKLHDYSFITPTSLIVIATTKTEEDTWTDHINLFSFDPSHGVSPPPPTNMKLIASLRLPQRVANNKEVDISIDSGRFFPAPTPGCGDMFTTAPESHIYVIHSRWFTGVGTSYAKLGTVVHRDTFVSLLKQHDTAPSPESRGFIPWEEWGPDNTRCVKVDTRDRYQLLNSVADGERVVWPVKEDGKVTTQIMDFNTRGRYYDARAGTPDGVSTSLTRLVTEPTTLVLEEDYVEPIVSTLPYYTTPILDVEPRDVVATNEDFALNQQGLFREKSVGGRRLDMIELYTV
ncbi:hypothetical protein DENSPDRAFT_274520 [Dentipellis sp. KUC8613]|nr:hypothetical protein DENSPDRAFT_274520 [Dentipellis sp. KUC8613]